MKFILNGFSLWQAALYIAKEYKIRFAGRSINYVIKLKNTDDNMISLQ
ncbi:hypothetical protein AND4_11769 [Vibrio sp. AND4]|nr:hypothetical protein AND4_11769 [Vibrio sp. AND4]